MFKVGSTSAWPIVADPRQKQVSFNKYKKRKAKIWSQIALLLVLCGKASVHLVCDSGMKCGPTHNYLNIQVFIFMKLTYRDGQELVSLLPQYS